MLPLSFDITFNISTRHQRFIYIRLLDSHLTQSSAVPFSLTPGRPVESHHQSPTDPYVNLSAHTAPVSLPLESSRSQAYIEKIKFLPVSRLTCCLYELTHPLRSILITRTSSLLQDDPPPSCASILSPFVVLTYRVFSSHHMKSSHVLQKSPNQAHANCTPSAA